MPSRIRLQRTRGWRLPDGAVHCARPGRYGNPYRVGDAYTNPHDGTTTIASTDDVIRWHRQIVWSTEGDRHGIPTLDEIADELGGHDLACWCRLDRPCHVDTLLTAANRATCNRCGDCCDRIRLSVGTWQMLSEPERVDVRGTPGDASDRNREFCSTHWTPVARSDESIVVMCDAFDRETRTCTVQATKPPICAGYPYYGKSPDAWADVDDAGTALSERCSFRADYNLPVLLTRKPKL